MGSTGGTGSETDSQPLRGRPRRVHTARASQYCRSAAVPPAMAEALAREDAAISMRIYLLDNSGSMASGDGTLLEGTRLVPATRWEELVAVAIEQAEWNRDFGIPCEFQLLNSPCPQNPQEGIDIFTVDKDLGDTGEQVRALHSKLICETPNRGTPLATRLDDIRRRIARTASEAVRQGMKFTVTIATDGVPNEPRYVFVNALRQLMTELPISVVLRICTNEQDVADFYDEVDKEVEMPLDIVDDLRGEALNVFKSNPWLAYSPLLQTIRIAGTHTKVFDFIDERALTPMEVSLCAQLLVRRQGLPPYSRHPQQFLEELERDLPLAALVFDSRSNKLVPPLDFPRLQAAVFPGKYGGIAGLARSLGLGSLIDVMCCDSSPSRPQIRFLPESSSPDSEAGTAMPRIPPVVVQAGVPPQEPPVAATA